MATYVTGETTRDASYFENLQPADIGDFLCIDMKSFYASVECVDRGLDPMQADLVVADPERGDGTICLAVSPHLKAQGVSGRARVFEIPKNLEYIKATPRMRRYMRASSDVYATYLRWVAPEDAHAYSCDEAFLNIGPYLRLYGCTAEGLARKIVADVRERTGLVATAGVGTNLFLAKVACDVIAKHSPDFIGVLNSTEYRRRVWSHRPITDVWGVGPATARRLREHFGVVDMGGVTRIGWSELHREFGANARHLADHARGIEPTTMAEIKAWRPSAKSISSGQVLMRDYAPSEALTVVLEMADEVALELVRRGVLASKVSAWAAWPSFGGTSGGLTLAVPTDDRDMLVAAVDAIMRPRLLGAPGIRRIGVALSGLVPFAGSQPSLFGNEDEGRSRALQRTVAATRKRFGETAVMRGRSLRDGATGFERNLQIGGHRA